MEKIFIEKGEGLGEVVEKLIASGDSEVTLVFPREAKFRESLINFNILKREAENAKKSVVVESVDEEILALADAAKIGSVHPLFTGGKSRSLSDIMTSKGEAPRKRGRPRKEPAAKKGKKVSLKIPVSAEDPMEEEEVQEMRQVAEVPLPNVRTHHYPHAPAEESYEEILPEEESPRRSRRWVWITALLAVLVAAGIVIANVFFARADVAINLNTTSWQFSDTITASRTASGVDPSRRVIPAEVFKDERNTTQLFPASSKAQVSQKASGRITIYNAYSSQPQTLVATTRFETPDGKVYRLDSQVIVPAAEVKDGKITPSSIQATVYADAAGPAYNVGPVEKLTIPGFKGTPRFEGFYGSLSEGAKDGFIGERATPTDQDIASAREKTTEILKTSLQGNLLSKRPKDFKVLEGTSEVTVTRLTVNRNTDQNGNFSVFGEASFQAIGFRESDVRSMLVALADKEYPNTDFHELELSYTAPKASFERGDLTVTLDADGSLASAFAPDEFKGKIAGRNVNEARSMILDLPGLADAKISLWPFWLRTLPKAPEKIRINLNYL